MSGALQKLQLSRWDLSKQPAVSSAPRFSVLLNPAQYSRSEVISYTTNSDNVRVDKAAREVLTLPDLVFDGTGAVPQGGAAVRSVDDQLGELRAVVAEPLTGAQVGRPVVELLWGSLYFVGRLTALEVRYTLFKPSGEPLRARVTLKFVEYEDDYAHGKPAPQATGPGATQIVEVKAGSTLPLISFDVYQDPTRDQALARANDLDSLRQPQPGSQLAAAPA
jgi:nucleoid-associated protein YgaU